jgi:hypothetical protein
MLNPLNAELNLICHLLALLGAHPIFHVSRIRVNTLTDWLCITEVESVYCAVRNEFFYIKQRNFISKGFISFHTSKLLKRGIIRIKMGARPKDSRREFLKTLQI